MLTDFLVGLVWIGIVLLPAVVASRQPVVSHNGYLENYMNAAGQDVEAGSVDGSATDR